MLHTATHAPSFTARAPDHPWPSAASAEPREASDVDLIRHAFAPATLSDAVAQHLSQAARLVRCPAGPFEIASPRRPEPSWWLLRRGRMGLGALSANGTLVEKRSIGAGDWLETAGAMSGPGTWLEPSWCHTPVELLAVPLSAMSEACAMDPAFPQAYAAVLAQRVRALNDSLHDLVSADVAGRLARWLLRQTPAYELDGVATVLLAERKQALARHLATTSESLSRALRRLSDEGMVEVNGYAIALLDADSLRRLAYPTEADAGARR